MYCARPPASRLRAGQRAADLAVQALLESFVLRTPDCLGQPGELMRSLQRSSRCLHRGDDLGVTGAAAEIARQRTAHDRASSGSGWRSSSARAATSMPGVQKPHWKAPVLGEGVLQRVHRASSARPSSVVTRLCRAVVRQRQAGAHRHAVDAAPCRRRRRPGCSRAWRR